MLRSKEQPSRHSRNPAPRSTFARTTILVGLVGLVALSVQPWHATAPRNPTHAAAADHSLIDASASARIASGDMTTSSAQPASFTARFNAYGESLGAQ
jgi:hypothetical protein